MSSSIISKLKYKKERVGLVERDGKTYVKYVKARRFRVSSGFKRAVLWIFLLVVLGLVIRYLMSSLCEMNPTEGTPMERTLE